MLSDYLVYYQDQASNEDKAHRFGLLKQKEPYTSPKSHTQTDKVKWNAKWGSVSLTLQQLKLTTILSIRESWKSERDGKGYAKEPPMSNINWKQSCNQLWRSKQIEPIIQSSRK